MPEPINEEGPGDPGQIMMRISDEQWRAIIHNDPAYDHKFFYAVKSTGIFCRPSCKSRPPRKENVRIYGNAKEALEARFRPCKRCKPTGERLPDHEWAVQITRCIEMNYMEPLTLNILADMCHGSPYHLQRTFKRVMGITPTEYIQRQRTARAIEYLIHTEKAIHEIAVNVGIANTPYFITLFKKSTGHTPAEYRHKHRIKQNGG
ncbi:bifunctional transcriptional activator/DNA repair enzyme AdaA [Paenibacillus lutrae]|uniref:AraC family transcriptional regulator n=1 Tax=Paenibacillus lutrae TaxID=2078573 RepID=A0A7X3FLU2_9BACL|nr:bifunctional transcriptional activator/DNA repair enzyme AdaA [Paenibacillus lutrae]MVP01849.1 AraC family transcriptional regulator [Paenibacillus lutrae]